MTVSVSTYSKASACAAEQSSGSEQGRRTKRAQLPDSLGRYRIWKRLHGGPQPVYLAHDTVHDRAVALKTVTLNDATQAEAIEQFHLEIGRIIDLRHPGICPVFDAGETDNICYVNMAFIDGQPLSDFIKPERPMPTRTAVRIVRAIANALQYAHEHEIVHGLLTPSSVLINSRRQPMITNFGQSLLDSLILTNEDAVPDHSGIPVERHGQITISDDISSLGIILFKLLTGEDSLQQMPPAYENISPNLAEICRKMTAPDIENRFGTMREVISELDSCEDNPSAAEAPNPSVGCTQRIPERSVKKSMKSAKEIDPTKSLSSDKDPAPVSALQAGFGWKTTAAFAAGFCCLLLVCLSDETPSAEDSINNPQLQSDVGRVTNASKSDCVLKTTADLLAPTSKLTQAVAASPANHPAVTFGDRLRARVSERILRTEPQRSEAIQLLQQRLWELGMNAGIRQTLPLVPREHLESHSNVWIETVTRIDPNREHIRREDTGDGRMETDSPSFVLAESREEIYPWVTSLSPHQLNDDVTSIVSGTRPDRTQSDANLLKAAEMILYRHLINSRRDTEF